MGNADDESALQYFAIKNEEDNFVDISDILNLPSASEEVNFGNKQVFYLTFDNNEENEEKRDPLDCSKNAESINHESAMLDNETDVKIITLDDYQILMTDNSFEKIDTSDLIVNNIEEQYDHENLTQFSNEEESVDNSDVNSQLLELDDGSQAVVITLYKIQNEDETTTYEAPKKIRKFPCHYEGCDKAYTTSNHLTVHERVHTDYKPFRCMIDGCEKKFATNYSLKAHIRTHTGEKPYGCSFCTKQFKTSGDLQKHVRIHTGEKPFECPVEGCGKSFTTSNIRKVHIRSHTGERPYTCDYPNCGKAFTSSTNFKNHLRIHSGEKPYVCAVNNCGKRFTEYSSLYKHNAVHQRNRPYTCIFCGLTFKQEAPLNYHKRLKHNVLVTKDGTEIIVNID